MAKFNISPADSVDSAQRAFDDGTADPDTLNVEAGAFLIGNLTGARLENAGRWKVTVDGIIFGGFDGIELQPNIAKTSTITISEDGQVGGDTGSGIVTQSSAIIDNAGTISGNHGIWNVPGGSTVINTGTIAGSFRSIETGAEDDTVTNSGTIVGDVLLGNGNNRLTNSGHGSITGDFDTFTGHDVLINKDDATIIGDIDLDAGNDALTNKATITGNIELGADDNTLKNTGKGVITGDIDLGFGNNTAINKATITGNVTSAFGADKLTNSGTIDGDVDLGNGADVFNNFKKKADGVVTGTIDLGDGDDTFNGGRNGETVADTDGADTINFNKGDDTFLAGLAGLATGNDVVDGGKGTDFFDASAAVNVVVINLSTSVQDDAGPPFLPIAPIAANTAFGVDFGSGATITNFENAAAGAAEDILFGSKADNLLQGNAAGDDLYGLGGDDQLEGGAGGDDLVGGAGRDVLIGGADDDTFWFFDVSDSGTKAATRDLIEDFEDDGSGGELINLSRIDANTTNGAGDDAFTFIGTNVLFSGAAGELRAYFSAVGQIVEGDVDGDAKADFSFEIADASHAITLSAAADDDFVL